MTIKRENPEESLQLQGEAVSGVHAAGAAREKRARMRHGVRGGWGGCCLHTEDPAVWTPQAPLSWGRRTGPAGWGGCRVPPQAHLLEPRCPASRRSCFSSRGLARTGQHAA